MLKYDVDLNENSDDSLSLILQNIKRNSIVLEFGPATGRMTKYLKEVLNCKVYIVELDPESAEMASQHSEDCLVGDIENFEWLKYFDDIKFDYIIFADVLEHLYDPQKVLSESKRLLNANGSIFISIPNVAHNSIIIDLINNKFNYQKIGLLDNTHIRFFTYYSLMEMFENVFLKPVKTLATYNRPHDTELHNNYDCVNEGMLEFLLKNKEFGEVYQFVFELKRASNEALAVKNIQTTPNYYYTQLFVNDGAGFEESKSIIKYINFHESNCLELAFNLSNFNNIDHLRIDPLNQPCILKIKKIILNNEIEVNSWEANASVHWGNLLVFSTDDPQILINTSQIEKVWNIEIALDLFLYNPDITSLIPYFVEYSNHIIENQNRVVAEKDNYLSLLSEEMEKLKCDMEASNDNLRSLLLESDQVKQSNESLIFELSSKEKEIVSLQNKLDLAMKHSAQINQQLIELTKDKRGAIARRIFKKR
ncbi:bifunctional 2-polyprenyl-6-hydroxyphenol methylase/3-demethylubiquinol 3-O-methyltransferase UbiG [Paenibacillus illinoisensis]|uniref:class I SAM-dependent methyltransferase n=1 Tax=Paenibacillus illinoisensis TaxID=59845 RepID=UPI001C8E8F70|nr:class I SAM-dependent methyltransferase [Paenibacillus illinoisensis]MBY0220375.1 class I SAM-dependent methyltransferase [Paenibacillus illinoisensis]